jgi:hypothetical protein
MNFNEFNAPIKYGATFDGDITVSNAGGSLYVGANTGIPFCTITSVGTAVFAADVTVLSDDYVTNGRTVYIGGFRIVGTGPWTESAGSTTTLSLKDGAGTTFVTWSASAIGQARTWYGNTYSGGSVAGGSMVLTSAYIEGGAATKSKGLVVNKSAGTLTYGTASGSPFYISVWGVIR